MARFHDCYIPAQSDRANATPALSRQKGQATRLGILGRISPGKGIELVLEQLLEQCALKWQLLISGAGNPTYVNWLQATYADPRIVFMGPLDPEVFFGSIDILLAPSKWHEPFGRATVDAYSHGIPVVGANCGGIPEVIEPHSALLFDPSQPHTLIEKISAAIRLLEDPCLGARLRRRAEMYSPSRQESDGWTGRASASNEFSSYAKGAPGT
jgi:glycosyltransferase involved in cell wall biosynthesis